MDSLVNLRFLFNLTTPDLQLIVVTPAYLRLEPNSNIVSSNTAGDNPGICVLRGPDLSSSHCRHPVSSIATP